MTRWSRTPTIASIGVAVAVALVVVVGVLPARPRSAVFALPGHRSLSSATVLGALTQPAVVAGASSEAWYCVAPPLLATSASQIELANLTPTARRLALLPNASSTRALGIVQLAPGATTTRPMGAHGFSIVEGPGGVAATVASHEGLGTQAEACQSTASDAWTLLGFDTGAGDRAVVRIANPFTTTAVVNVDPIGPSGTSVVTSTQGIVIEPGAAVNVNVAALEPGMTDAGVIVSAKNGRVVVVGATKPAGAAAPIVLDPQATQGRSLAAPWVPVVGLRSLTVVLANPGANVVRATVRVVGLRGSAGSAASVAGGRGVSERVVVPSGSTVVVPLTAEALAEPSAGVQLTVHTSGGGVSGVVDIERRGVLDGRTLVPLEQVVSQGWFLSCSPSAGMSALAFEKLGQSAQLTIAAHTASNGGQSFETNLLHAGVIGLGDLRGVAWYAVTATQPVALWPVASATGCAVLGVVGSLG